jgi:catechol 2,3-dioxygenase-like lactoylglutathione lyase family enzyme
MILAQRMTIVTLGVSDLVVATKFYQETLGWTKSSSSTDSISFFLLPDNGMLLGLYPTDKLAEDVGIHSRPSALPTTGAPPFRGFTLAYCTKSIEEVDQIFADLRIKGVTILKEPEKVFWGGYSGYMADPDHNLWEIAYNPYLQMDDQGKLV